MHRTNYIPLYLIISSETALRVACQSEKIPKMRADNVADRKLAVSSGSGNDLNTAGVLNVTVTGPVGVDAAPRVGAVGIESRSHQLCALDVLKGERNI